MPRQSPGLPLRCSPAGQPPLPCPIGPPTGRRNGGNPWFAPRARGFPGFVDHLPETKPLTGRGSESLVVEAAGRDQGDLAKKLVADFKAKEAAQKDLERQEQEAARASRVKEDAERKRRELEQYLMPKAVGEMVCKDGNRVIFFSVTVRAFVEDVSGSRIRLRVVDTGGMTSRYNGVTLAASAVIWDDYQEWKGCGP